MCLSVDLPIGIPLPLNFYEGRIFKPPHAPPFLTVPSPHFLSPSRTLPPAVTRFWLSKYLPLLHHPPPAGARLGSKKGEEALSKSKLWRLFLFKAARVLNQYSVRLSAKKAGKKLEQFASICSLQMLCQLYFNLIKLSVVVYLLKIVFFRSDCFFSPFCPPLVHLFVQAKTAQYVVIVEYKYWT